MQYAYRTLGGDTIVYEFAQKNKGTADHSQM